MMRAPFLVSAAAVLGVSAACAQDQPADLTARLQTGIAAYDAGRRADAFRIFDTFIDSYNTANGRLNSRDLLAVGTALRYLGEADPQLFKDALQAFDEAVAADPGNHAARVAVGHLFLDKYNAPEARAAFDAVLAAQPNHAAALVGRALALDFEQQPGALDAARQALAADPDHIDAHVFLTTAFIGLDDLDSARVHAAAVERAAPQSLEAAIALASVAQAGGRTTDVDRVRSRWSGNPIATARLNVALAELSARQRQYAQGVAQARVAVAADSMNWRAWSVLGTGQLRLGDVAGARASLERAFAGDPYNVWTKNTLDLLDRLAAFETRTTPHFTIVASARDIDVLAPWIERLGETAFAQLRERYGYTPPTPVRIELFDRHADFSVRTLGLPGLGALGVSFGSVLAMDAPSARERGDFNWGSTFWHELAHAFHLGMTDFRVPRWFTEGLAVWEERRARAGWGDEALPLFEAALKENRLLPLADLNRGFARPTYPQQVVVSYYQASLFAELIERQYGVAALRDLLNAFKQGKDTEAAIRAVLKVGTTDLDRAFSTFAHARVSDTAHAARIEAASDYAKLAAATNVTDLESAAYIYPYDIALHERLAEQHARAGNWADAVVARRVVVALQPVDMAEAHYQLAHALLRAGDRAGARREVLRALEAAPNFQRAQELLLELAGGAS